LFNDVLNYWEFYRSPLGSVIKKLVRRHLLEWWPARLKQPHQSNEELLGYGYPLPFLRPYLRAGMPTIAMMPDHLGVIRWPHNADNTTCLIHEPEWPARPGSVERILLVHALEQASNIHQLMAEVARVLTPQGRLMVIVPHRHSLWARAEFTPFGHGQPYSLSQLNGLLRAHDLTLLRHRRILRIPPSNRHFWLNAAFTTEVLGQRLFPNLGGLLMVEATKQVLVMKPRTVFPRRGLLVAPTPAIGLSNRKVEP
jgi:hypothetical protein